jgi:5-methylcytosine-specific restriction endonuclease McrBC GTP-binding regulatory subunit McrB
MRVLSSPDFNQAVPPKLLIMTGAPGAGKSHRLNEMSKAEGVTVYRTTFHQELTYSDFVGSYKPVPIYVEGVTTYDSDGAKIEGALERRLPIVKYTFQAGPFINAYVEATTNKDRDVVLLIEEINRANPASVFGDILQLLDLNRDGESTYPIDTSGDLAAYLKLRNVPDAAKLSIPSNLFIWATMNRADESVSYVDSAFLRRWDTYFIPHDEHGQNDPTDIKHTSIGMKWGIFREKINRKLESIGGIEDDKFIGPYFVKEHELQDPQRLFSKLITYLWHDVVPMDRDQIFIPGKSLTTLHKMWIGGENILVLD